MFTSHTCGIKTACKSAFLLCLMMILAACGGGSVSNFSDDDIPSPVVDGIEDDGTVDEPEPGADPVSDDELASLPAVSAGGRQFADPNVLINLVGIAEAQGDATIVATLWVQLEGPTVTIPNPLSAQNVVVVPDLAEEAQLLFQFIAQDSEGRVNAATTSVVVQPRESFVRVVGGYVSETSETGAEFAVRLDDAQTSDLVIDYVTVAGSASEGEDYEFTQGTLTILAGETEATVNVPIVDSDPTEGDESFSLQITVDSEDTPASNSGVMVIQNNAEFVLIPQQIAFTDVGPIVVRVGGTVDNPILESSAPGTGAVTYVSSDTSIATVDSEGVVSTVGTGDITITATKAADLIYSLSVATYSINVEALLLQNITFESEGPFTVNVGDTINNVIATSSELGTGVLTYTSSDETLATVDATGLVTTLAEGDVIITATKAADDTYAESSDSYNVTVVTPAAQPPILSTTPSPSAFTVDEPANFVIENFGGGSLVSCSTDGILPAGLILDIDTSGDTCELSGIPTELLVEGSSYDITATNAAGSSTESFFIAVIVDAPLLSTPAPEAFEVNFTITPVTLTNNGGGRLTDCSPADGVALPTGLTLGIATDGTNCELSGEPSEVVVATSYPIVATNPGGSSQTNLNIRVSNPLLLSIATIKSFDFSFQDLPGVNHYVVYEDPDGSSAFTELSRLTVAIVPQLLSQPPAELTNILVEDVPLYARANARYRLDTCFSIDESDCYPSDIVSVDETIVAGIGYFKASNPEAGDNFGDSVAISGDGLTMAIGAPSEDSGATEVNGDQTDNSAPDAGAVYTFIRSEGTDPWVPQNYLKAENGEAGDQFGAQVALSEDGSVLVVSAPGEDGDAFSTPGENNSEEDAGAVYVFGLVTGIWQQGHYLKASNAEAGDAFGQALSLNADGRRLVIGAPGEDSAATGVNGDDSDNTATDSGAAYIFEFDDIEGEFWFQTDYIKAPNTDADDLFGTSVAISGNGIRFAIGASGESSAAQGPDGDASDNSAAVSGAAYVYSFDPILSLQTYFKASNAETGDFFGSSVSMSDNGTRLVVGATGEDSNAVDAGGDQTDNSLEGAGAAYVFDLVGEEWSQTAYLKASNTDAGDGFGSALALSGGGQTLVVAAEREDGEAIGINGDASSNETTLSGAVNVFSISAGEWQSDAYVKSINTDPIDSFGSAVDVTTNGSAIIVGARNEDSAAIGVDGDDADNTADSAGAAYIY